MVNLYNKSIEFTARNRQGRSKDKTFDLLHGVTCPTCNNVIYAVFKTKEEVKLWDYEETAVLHTREGQHLGQFNYFFPTVETAKGKSCYESTFSKVENESYQTLRMKNHVINPEKIGKETSDKYDVGDERPCTFAAVVSIRKDMAVKSAVAMCIGTDINLISALDFEDKSEEIMKDLKAQGLSEAKTYGPVPIHSILLPRSKIQFGYYTYSLQQLRIK